MKYELTADAACWEFKLNHPEEFASFGCGPGGMGDRFVPDTIYGLSIKNACRIHDWDYRFGNGASKFHRKLCDQRLKENTFIIVEERTSQWILRRLRLTRCRFYYFMVRAFGKKAYWSERKGGD